MNVTAKKSVVAHLNIIISVSGHYLVHVYSVTGNLQMYLSTESQKRKTDIIAKRYCE